MNPTVFTVDPGTSGTGIAVWDYARFKAQIPKWVVKPGLVAGFSFRQSPIFTPREVLFKSGSRSEIWFWISTLIRLHDCRMIICEDAEYRRGLKGKMVAEAGDLVSLAKLLGGIEWIAERKSVQIEFVSAIKWKGTWDKAKVVNHIKMLWEDSIHYCKNEKTAHTWEAVGIGYWKLGRL